MTTRTINNNSTRNWEGGRKRLNGQYFTVGNPFVHPAFIEWAKNANLSKSLILEPFAGSNSLIQMLQSMNLCNAFDSFDIEPNHPSVVKRDTLLDFPKGYDACITNPPWLAKNSATVRGLPFPDCKHDDIYKFALEKCLDHCKWVAILIPESYIRTNLFRDRLQSFISLTFDMFSDTGHPVGLALFGPETTNDVTVWSGNKIIGTLLELNKLRPVPIPEGVNVKFNDPAGNLGLIALDNTREPSIRFCNVRELENYEVKHSCRHITKLSVDCPLNIREWNSTINQFRELTDDVLMTSYKGIRKDGKYRRRCDWSLARGIIHHAN